jgi:hypothetical protein
MHIMNRDVPWKCASGAENLVLQVALKHTWLHIKYKLWKFLGEMVDGSSVCCSGGEL